MAKTTKGRHELHERVARRIGQTSLVEYSGEVPGRNNSVWIKMESDNPWGSHYDRVYAALFRDFEANRGLTPGKNVLETSSGSAGVSFAGIGKELGYECFVMIPDGDLWKKRREAIEEQGGRVILTPEEEGIHGFTRKRIVENIRSYRAAFLNHSMESGGAPNEVTLRSLEGIADEVLVDMPILDVYVVGMGNGSSVVGPGRVFRDVDPEIKIVGYKPKQSGASPLIGLMNQDGLDPSVAIDFPHLKMAEDMVDEVVTVGELRPYIERDGFGRTTVAGLQVALDVAKESEGKNILVVAYDKAERY